MRAVVDTMHHKLPVETYYNCHRKLIHGVCNIHSLFLKLPLESASAKESVQHYSVPCDCILGVYGWHDQEGSLMGERALLRTGQ